jgi:hypothetical protein
MQAPAGVLEGGISCDGRAPAAPDADRWPRKSRGSLLGFHI